ncbi:uncharacterized protein LOC129741732 [Uranotaenia lowii]|uniref:uncharacterized protein LOC129741732 n=1 Tax=Uranotaenia lowii TaxID=190385 RepID=UPI0024795EA2|nr:uncharacterized protein LOC129741732 [Uranotaenia lowii]
MCWQTALSVLNGNLSKRMIATKQKHRKKLASLANAQPIKKNRGVPKTIEKFVVNLSSIQLSDDENALLNKGLNFAVAQENAPIAEIVNNIESAIQFRNFPSKAALRYDIANSLQKASRKKHRSKAESSGCEKVLEQLKKREVVFTRADKGNAVVILDKQDYDTKVRDMISSGPYEECMYKNGKPKDPLNMLIEEANIARQKVALLMGEVKLERKFLVPNPKVASLYCLPKIHKNPVAMRPISSNICTPTEKMAAWLVEEMRKYPVKHGKSVKNSVELVEKLKNFKVRRGEILVSFDVSALFPSVPIPDALRSLRRHLDRRRAPPNNIEAYVTVAEVCMNQNFFLFRGKFYKQTFGLSMGSKLSPLLAELFMSDFEHDLEKSEKLFPRVWWRYVDDIFATVKERYLSQTLELLNCQHSSIKFTVEKEIDGKLPFLDLLISRKDDSTVKFGIYRKPTSTDRYITADSNHFGAQKQAAFHSMAHRLYNIPMETSEFNNEKEKILSAANLNGYDKEFVHKILRKHERKKFRANATTFKPEKEESQRVSLPFFPLLTNDIRKILSNHGLKVAYKSSNTLKDRLVSLKDKVPPEERSGIYEIPPSHRNGKGWGNSFEKTVTLPQQQHHQLQLQPGNRTPQHLSLNGPYPPIGSINLPKPVASFGRRLRDDDGHETRHAANRGGKWLPEKWTSYKRNDRLGTRGRTGKYLSIHSPTKCDKNRKPPNPSNGALLLKLLLLLLFLGRLQRSIKDINIPFRSLTLFTTAVRKLSSYTRPAASNQK